MASIRGQVSNFEKFQRFDSRRMFGVKTLKRRCILVVGKRWTNVTLIVAYSLSYPHTNNLVKNYQIYWALNNKRENAVPKTSTFKSKFNPN